MRNGDDLRRAPLAVRKATQARVRGDRVKAAQLALSLGAIAGLDQVEEPGRTGGAALGGGSPTYLMARPADCGKQKKGQRSGTSL